MGVPCSFFVASNAGEQPVFFLRQLLVLKLACAEKKSTFASSPKEHGGKFSEGMSRYSPLCDWKATKQKTSAWFWK